jgi:hypothetical protein
VLERHRNTLRHSRKSNNLFNSRTEQYVASRPFPESLVHMSHHRDDSETSAVCEWPGSTVCVLYFTCSSCVAAAPVSSRAYSVFSAATCTIPNISKRLFQSNRSYLKPVVTAECLPSHTTVFCLTVHPIVHQLLRPTQDTNNFILTTKHRLHAQQYLANQRSS